ncbi:MAG: DUF3788 family protein [Candidatus Hodarchaeales archaeon]|jgi:hypothetical protein
MIEMAACTSVEPHPEKIAEAREKSSDDSLEDLLKDSYQFYMSIFNSDSSFRTEWKFYSKKSGWILKISKRKRTICYLNPLVGKLRITFTLNQKEEQLAKFSQSIGEKTKNLIGQSKKYREGRLVHLIIGNDTEIDEIHELMEIKQN